MRVLIIGGNGMLGHKLVQVLSRRFQVYYTIRGKAVDLRKFGFFDPDRAVENINVKEESAILRAIETISPEVVINAAGIVKQRPDSSDVIETLFVNSILPHRLSGLTVKFGFRLITISTDCVFSGRKGNYSETDETDATDVYGRSKQLGEPVNERTLTIRTSIIGRELDTRHGLVEWFLARSGERINGYRNAIFSGFPTVVLADILSGLITDFPYLSGLYHVSAEPISKFDLLGLINETFKAGCEIIPVDEPRIDRSLDSLKFRTATGFKLLSWEEMIGMMFRDAEETEYVRRP